MYDVAIVGAGPAGSSLARLLARNLRVVLIDPRRLDRSPAGDTAPRKLCGGLLAPAAQKELARQGLGVPAQIIDGPQLFAVRTVDLDTGAERLYQRHYVNVDRDRLDRWLFAQASARVECAPGLRVSSAEEGSAGTLLRLRSAGGAPASICARLVVGADGASSAIRAFTGTEVRRDARFVAMQGVFERSDMDPHYGALFSQSLTSHYGWTIPKGDAVLAGVALRPGGRARESFDRFVDGARDAGFALGALRDFAATPVVRPLSLHDVRLRAGECTVFIGEAAGLISPSSAEGISYALRSAAALAVALESGLDGATDRYARAAAPIAFEVVAKVAKAAVIGSPRMRRLALRSGIGSIPGRTEGTWGGVLGELLSP